MAEQGLLLHEIGPQVRLCAIEIVAVVRSLYAIAMKFSAYCQKA